MTPYALKDLEEVQRRLGQLQGPHMAPLERLRREIERDLNVDDMVPHFDPHDGGVDAEILFLLETPGRKAARSRFVSRDNPDPTARNLSCLSREAGIDRRRTLIWNIVPWYLGTESKIAPVSAGEIRTATPWLDRLLQLLPGLKVIVLMGRKAQRAASHLQTLDGVEVLCTWHPSNVCLNRGRGRGDEIRRVFREAEKLIDIGRGAT